MIQVKKRIDKKLHGNVSTQLSNQMIYDPEKESKYYLVLFCLFFFDLNYKLRMKFFGICFILYWLKLSAGYGKTNISTA